MLAASHIADPRPVAPCHSCERVLPLDAPEGLCPACLFALAQQMGGSDNPADISASDTHSGNETPVRLTGGRIDVLPGPKVPSPETIDLGRYAGLEPYLKGGIGEVFTATDTELHRVVALKRLQDRYANDPSSQRRFLLEAEVTARLEHPGVVPVHSLFRDDSDRPCYSMRFIQGQTLGDALKEYHAKPSDAVAFRRLLQSFIQVCEAIAYAHSRGVIHRDLKPQNIMLGQFGETLVVDWGLAKVVGRTEDERSTHTDATLRPVGDSSGDRTEMGSAVGTPAYMSPEQAAGRWDVINPVSDVYSLGAVLYAILTGRPPLEKGNWPEMQQKIQRGEFARPRSIKPTTPKALEAVCVKAMAMKPEDRYPSARELKADVEQWLADEPVKAYREPLIARLGRWARRRKERVVGLVASGIFVAIALAVGAVRLESERQKTEFEKKLRHMDNFKANVRYMPTLVNQHYKLSEEIRTALDKAASRVAHDPRLKVPELQSLGRDLLQANLEFWNKAIEIDLEGTGINSSYGRNYRLQRALCHARMGEHRQASDEARDLAASSSSIEAEPVSAYDFARVYGLCTAAAKNDDALVEQYAGLAMKFLREAANGHYFEGAARAERLKTDLDFSALRERKEFVHWLREVAAKPDGSN